MKSIALATILLIIISLPINAEITLDGTLGRGGPLPGPNYFIGAELGQQHGGNLFHSFRHFNLKGHESATFSGPNRVNNIIGRVTGGNPSNIDGLIRSTIPNANLYFLNPYGMIFGPNAKLDVQGSFHGSTADYLRLQDGGRFNARQPNNSLLTVAPVEAFGFVSYSPASLSIEGSQLSTPIGKTLSLVGGNITIKGAQLFAPSGRVSLASVAQAGDIDAKRGTFEAFKRQGTITLSDDANLNVDGAGAGEIVIRGGQLLMNHSTIQANTLADQTGKGIDMRLTDSIHINGNGLAVSNRTFGSGNAGHIDITTPRLEVNSGFIDSSSLGSGSGGNINVEATQVILQKGGKIESDAFSSGSGGESHVKATESVSILGQRGTAFSLDGLDYENDPSAIANVAYGTGEVGEIRIVTGHLNLAGGVVSADSLGVGNAGNIVINADTATLTEGSFISTTALVKGQHGNIKIAISDTLAISGRRQGSFIAPSGVFALENNQSAITSFTLGESQVSQAKHILISAATLILDQEGIITAATLGDGIAGDVIVQVKDLHLTNGGQINNSNGLLVGEEVFIGHGSGGAIHITATGDITVSGLSQRGLPSGIFSNTFSSGEGGNVEIQANNLTLTQDGIISANSLNIGNAGKITIQANTINLTEHSKISTEAKNAAGGNITITTPNLLYLRKGHIDTSVYGGIGQGGNISISHPVFVVLNQAEIHTHAVKGRGGNIAITSDKFVVSNDSSLDASSKESLDGEIVVSSHEVNLDDFLVVLPGGYIDAGGQLPPPCTATPRIRNKKNRFVVKRIAGSPPSPGDWKSNRLVLVQPEGEPRQNKTASPSRKDASAGMAHNGLASQPQAILESSVVDEQLF